jgi:S-adenosylmethionine:tRNA ribosyltransferase-isomerase
MFDISLNEYNYDLPADRIAQYPVDKRDNSKLLLFNDGIISQDIFKNIDNYLPENSFMVFNNTRVIRARLLFKKETGAAIEVFCLEPLIPEDYERSFSSVKPVEWKCIIGNLKKWKRGKIFTQFVYDGKCYSLSAEKVCQEGEAWRVLFSWDSEEICFAEVISSAGHIPLPPYVKREDEELDNNRYQTVYSSINGSVAAPTAGLHFTDNVLEKIRNKGIQTASVTLHVGAGTFQPVKSKTISGHEMHCEHFYISAGILEKLIENEDRIIAVGTTSVRCLESLYWIGVKLINNPNYTNEEFMLDQWEPYNNSNEFSTKESLTALLNFLFKRGKSYLHASTKIIIIPGYKFKMIDGIITNFHQPQSTLLLLISAWVGDDWKKIYRYAIDKQFRFLSYGDSSLLFRKVNNMR